MEKRKRRQKHCGEIAMARARRARREKKHLVVIGWIYITALLSIRTANTLLAVPRPDAGDDWPISDYERGFSSLPKQPRERYNVQPSMKRLMHDLRRPVAREDAMQVLLARIDDGGLRGWVIGQIREDKINRLAIHVRPSLGDAEIIASWQAELDAENINADEAVNDPATQVELTRKTPAFITPRQ